MELSFDIALNVEILLSTSSGLSPILENSLTELCFVVLPSALLYNPPTPLFNNFNAPLTDSLSETQMLKCLSLTCLPFMLFNFPVA